MSLYYNQQFFELLRDNIVLHPLVNKENIKWITEQLNIKPNQFELETIKLILRQTYNQYKNNIPATNKYIIQKQLEIALFNCKLFFENEKLENKGFQEIKTNLRKQREKFYIDYNDIYKKKSNAINRQKFNSQNDNFLL